MKKYNIKKQLYKYLVFALAILSFLGLVNVRAGYTYDSKGEPIYSTEGFTVNELPYTYSSLGINTSVNPAPADLFIYNIQDIFTKELIPQVIYLTDSALHSVYVFDTEFNLVQELNKFRFVPDQLYSTNLTAIRTSFNNGGNIGSKLMFPTSASVPTQEQLDDPNGEYGGKGYAELTLFKPSCTFRATIPSTGQEFIYICDKGNNQVILCDVNTWDEDTQTYEIYQIVTKPTDELDSDTAFSPDKIITDIEGRMYVIADNVLDGIMQFSRAGGFQRYTGTNEITLNAWDIFWRNLATESQLQSKTTLFNTTFASMVYYNSMIYTTSYAIKNSDGTINDKIMIKKINPSGDDTLRRNGYKVPMGDVKYVSTSIMGDKVSGAQASTLESITVNGYGVYSVVDSTKGRIFTYDNEGNLLYISGGKGVQADKLSNPVSVQYFGENLLVLDANKGTIVKFEPTEIASIINQAVKQESIGRLSRPEPTFDKNNKVWKILESPIGILSSDKNVAPTQENGYWYVDGQSTNVKVVSGETPVFSDYHNCWVIERKIETVLLSKKFVDPNAKVEEKEGYWYINDVNTGIKAEEWAATDYWQQVIKLNANYEYAYVGIGHKYLNNGEYKTAMEYFELGKNKIYYSKAFKQYRDGIIKEWFAPVAITLAVIIVGYYVFKFVRNKKLGIKKVEETGVGDE